MRRQKTGIQTYKGKMRDVWELEVGQLVPPVSVHPLRFILSVVKRGQQSFRLMEDVLQRERNLEFNKHSSQSSALCPSSRRQNHGS